MDDPPDFSDQLNDCGNSGPSTFGVSTYVAGFSGSGWLFVCCSTGSSCSSVERDQCLILPNGEWDESTCTCTDLDTPIVIDTGTGGFAFSSVDRGVLFDLNSDGRKELMAWTAQGSDDGFLVLDRNGNGVIDNGSELFGSSTEQADVPGVERNGFLALGESDRAENGGNGDGFLTAQDRIFSSLRVWIDENRDGLSEDHELLSLKQLGIVKISLDYWESRRRDEHGNEFRLLSHVGFQDRARRLASDVYLRFVVDSSDSNISPSQASLHRVGILSE